MEIFEPVQLKSRTSFKALSVSQVKFATRETIVNLENVYQSG